MSLVVSATASAVQGIQACMRRLDRAASVIAGGGGAPAAGAGSISAPATAPAGTSPESDIAGAMVDVLTAQRAFSAQLRVLRAAGRMADEAVRLGERAGGDRT